MVGPPHNNLIIVISAGGLCLTESFKPAAGLVRQTGLHLLVMGKTILSRQYFLLCFREAIFRIIFLFFKDEFYEDNSNSTAERGNQDGG